MNLSIILINYNVFDDICSAIESVKQNVSVSYEIIVVDNSSTDRSIDQVKDIYPEVVYLPLTENRGFGYANNRAMEIAKGEFFLLMNPDIVIQGDAINKLVEYIRANTGVGVVGPVQEKPNQGIERYYCFFPTLYSRFMQEFGFYKTAPGMRKIFTEFWNKGIAEGKPFQVDWVIGSCMLLRREIFENIGGFDEAFFLYEEETEWQYRMSKIGWKMIILPEATVLHNHHSSTSKVGTYFREFHEYRSRILFSKKHDKFFKKFVRSLILISGLVLRIAVNFIFYLFTFKTVRLTKVKLFVELLKFQFKPAASALDYRYDFNKYKHFFASGR